MTTDDCNLKDIDWRSYPNLDNHEERKERHSGCTKGGKDHVVIWPQGDRRSTVPRAWCRWCNKGWALSKEAVKYTGIPVPREPVIDQGLAYVHHKSITQEAYNYYASRGIHPLIADSALLGWKKYWNDSLFNRYSIPCFYPHKGKQTLWGIQYRASTSCPKNKRYISEPGSINTMLFNSGILKQVEGLYVLIVESPLDSLALTSYGYPAISPFDGNAKGSWRREWTALLKNIPERIIIPDNDESGTGDLLAMDKADAMRNSRILRLPPEFKDTGKLIEHDVSTAQDRLAKWLNLPSILGSQWS